MLGVSNGVLLELDSYARLINLILLYFAKII